MMYRSHAIMGVSAGISTVAVIVSPAFTMQSLIMYTSAAMVAYLGSLIPDIDHTESFIGSRIKIVSWLTSLMFEHRGFTHSVLFFIIVEWLLLWTVGSYGAILVNDVYIHAFVAGMLSHMIGDLLTKGGVRVFYPLTFKPSLTFMRTGSLMEFPLAALVSIIIVISSLHGWGIFIHVVKVIALTFGAIL